MDDYRASAMSGLFDAPKAAESDLDEGVKECLPPGSEVLSVKGHGASLWTRSARVDTKLAEGTLKSYFLKTRFSANQTAWSMQVATGDNGRSMMRGEFESSKAINAVISGFAPGPVAWGTFKSDPDLHFFLQDN
ncbi:hypothetical protein NA56DRAFT_710202 [Hyaloscypha hepaticicola]|uniref:Uncharacterized protein n=1 Tax=Hyaloscypha hepaticicola TaxID=2082293 RepID=A0A2J6PN09_9HELO|nr:hypothetical protein NA56DRAFT_710202 [Hyaloscypha hepaticicola]